MTTAPLPPRAIVIGHLTITTPATGAILLMPFLGSRMFGPHLFVYYVLAGVGAAWQWYWLALRGWEEWLVRKGVQGSEEDHLVRRAGLVWPGEAVIGPFALHTTAAAVCGIHFGPWLLSRWFVWILPLAGMSTGAPTGTDYFRHLELASIVPALVVGYLLSQYLPRLGTLAWFVPTVILVYKLLTFTEPYASILGPHSSTRFRTSSTFNDGCPLLRLLPPALVVSIQSVLRNRCLWSRLFMLVWRTASGRLEEVTIY
jgi:hypothetical protein